MSFTIEKLHLREISLSLKEPFRISSGTVQTRRILLLRLEDADGTAAWSECVADAYPNYASETIQTAWIALTEWLAPRVLGVSFASPGEVSPRLDRDIRGHRMAKAALEMGIWALAAARDRTSLASLLGGTRGRIEVGISIGIQKDENALLDRVRQAVNAGYRRIKIKIEPGRDTAPVRRIREEFGPGLPLMVDANSAYTPADRARLVSLDRFGLMMIEQPLADDDLVRHAALQRELVTPLCLDESITSPDRAEDMITLGSGRIINIKPGRVGGFGPALTIHDLCARNGIPVWCGGMLESGIGRAYNVALASLPDFSLPGDVSPSQRYWERDVVKPEWSMEDGRIRVPFEVPGLGVEVDEEYISSITLRSTTLHA